MHVLQPEPAVGIVNGDGPIHPLVSPPIFAAIGKIVAEGLVAEGDDHVLDVQLAVDQRAAVVEEIEEVAAEPVWW